MLNLPFQQGLCNSISFHQKHNEQFYSTFRTVLLLPSILRRIDDILLVKELNAKYFDHSIDEHQLLVALSAPSAGLEFDYERLELLGESEYTVLAHQILRI